MKVFTQIFVVFFILLSQVIIAQKESANWYFGEKAGINFNTEPPTILTNGQLITNEGCTTISDRNGNLLFYTDGINVWDRKHQKMPNGVGLYGHSSSTESAIIIPNPGNPSLYYIFTVDQPSYYLDITSEPIRGINYSVVDMTLNNGYGDIVAKQKNIHLVTYDTSNAIEDEYKSSEKITAVSHSNGTSIWFITQFTNKFYAFEIDANGIHSPIISSINESVQPVINKDKINISAIGYLKISPNGKKIAIAHSSTRLPNERSGENRSGKVVLYDFNNTTGKVSNERVILNNEYPYGVEFSPNSNLLYITSGIYDKNGGLEKSYLYQYDLGSSNLVNSKKIINDSQNVPGALQLAINGKIYRAGYPTGKDGTHLSVINAPNQIGNACNYSHNSIYLEEKLATLGLPPFIQSIFKYSFDYRYTCLGDETEFEITTEDPYDTAKWDFGDGTTSIQENPLHQYTSPGNYTVKLYLSINGIDYDPLIKQITIAEPPQVFNGTYQLTQCDSFDNDPTDGISTFDLTDANSPITLHTTDFINVNYYHSITEAENDILNLDYIDPIYENLSQNELVYAKVYGINPDCYNIVPVELHTTSSSNITTYRLKGCDFDNTGNAMFDLNLTSNEVTSDLNLSGNTNISYHETQKDAAIGTNPLPLVYESSSKSLYIRVENNNICYGGGILELEAKPFPQIEDQELSVCASEFPIEINSGISIYSANDYQYLWNTNEYSNTISIHQPGHYTVTVSDPDTGCKKQTTVIVNEIMPPQINDIKINDTDIEAILDASIEDYEFSIDNQYNEYQQSPIFNELPPGSHTLYVRDLNNCNTISREFSIIGFPNFFTPNSDGINDTWNLYGLDQLNIEGNIHVMIFDRYGKLIKTFNPHSSKGWDGTYKGHLMPPDDYWYYVEIPNAQIYKGHFSLKI